MLGSKRAENRFKQTFRVQSPYYQLVTRFHGRTQLIPLRQLNASFASATVAKNEFLSRFLTFRSPYTGFLLAYSPLPVIQAATNKSEAFNKFVQWVCFGGEGVITENVRDEQRKFIKYNHLVANLLSFHTLVTMTKALQQLLEEGHTVDMEALTHSARIEPSTSTALAIM